MKQPPGSLKYRVALAIAFSLWSRSWARSRRRANRSDRSPAAASCSTAAGGCDPAGKQIPLDTLPMSTALSPDGKYLLVLNGGYRPPSHQRDRNRLRRASSAARRWPTPGWASPSRPRATASTWAAARKASVFEFTFANGTLTPGAHLRRRAAGAARHAAISSAMWPSRPMAACSTPPSCTSDSHRGDQSAIRHGDRPLQDRPPALPHPLPSRWQVVLRHPLGRWHAGPLRRRQRQPDLATVRDRRASHRYGLARRRPGEAAPGEPHLGRAPVRGRRQYQQRLRRGRQRRQGAERRGEHQRLHDAAAAAGHDALRPGAQPRWQAALRGLLRRQRRRGGGCFRSAQPRRRLHSHRLVSHRRARAALGHAGGAQRQGPALLSQSQRSEPRASRPEPVHEGVPQAPSTWAACRPARPPGSSPSPTSSSKPGRTRRSPIRPTATRSWTSPTRCRPSSTSSTSCGESHLRPGAGRHEGGQRRCRRWCSSAKTSRPTCTSWRASSCCWTTST